MRVKRRSQMSDAGVQTLLLLAQGVELLLFAVKPGAESSRLAENINLWCALLIPQVRDLSFQLFEEIFQSDPSLTFHIVVQVSFFEGFQLFRRFDRACDRLATRNPLLLATVLVVAIFAIAIVLVGSFPRVGAVA